MSVYAPADLAGTPRQIWYVQFMLLFIINEHDTIQNMPRTEIAPDLDLYRPALQKWMPKAEIRAAMVHAGLIN